MIHSVFGEFESERAEQFFLDRLRHMTIGQRWQAVAEMRQIAVNMVRDTMRAEHPEWTEPQIKLETTRQIMEAHGTIFRANYRVPERY
jgi:hypothetical protein